MGQRQPEAKGCGAARRTPSAVGRRRAALARLRLLLLAGLTLVPRDLLDAARKAVGEAGRMAAEAELAEYLELDADDRERVDAVLAGTGCEVLVSA